ncbi:mate-domain-containing protein [Sporodiniella umbellata]|nr:mate-domain-containing protein [Sporodiniella umbellata]
MIPKDEEVNWLLQNKGEKNEEISETTKYGLVTERSMIEEETSLDILDELMIIFQYGLPLILTFLMGVGNRVWDVWFLGKTDSRDMAIASLGHLFITVAGISIGSGLLTAIETLVSQAFTSANNPHTIGAILQRGLLVMFVFATMVTIIWMNSEFILLSMGQDKELAKMASNYIWICIPIVYINYANTTIRKFLQSIGEMKITMYLVFLLFPLNIASNYFFLIYLKLAYVGAAIHYLVVSSSFLVFYLIYLYNSRYFRQFWPDSTYEAFRKWGEFLKLGIPGMLSMSTDWAFEVCALLTGVLGPTSLASQSIILSINTLLLMVPSGLSTGMAVRLGHLLGAQKPHKSKACVILSSCTSVTLTLFNAVSIYLFRQTIASHFSKDQEVIDLTAKLLRVVSVCHLTMGIGITFSYTLNSLGKQKMVAFLNLVSYYIVGLPFGLYLTHVCGWGLEGVWSGFVLSNVIKAVVEFFIIFFVVDWPHECLLAAQRVETQECL